MKSKKLFLVNKKMAMGIFFGLLSLAAKLSIADTSGNQVLLVPALRVGKKLLINTPTVLKTDGSFNWGVYNKQ
jgi:hypothetical protein